MNIKEKAYFLAPLFLQNVIFSLYGLKLKRERYGEFYSKRYEELIESQYWNRDQYLNFQEKEFISLIIYAKLHIPYYKKSLADIEIKTIEDIKKIPILNKEILRTKYNEFIDINLNKKRFNYTNTSGSTGTPLRIPVYSEGRQANYAFFERAKRWAGISEKARSVTFAGRVFVSPNAAKPPFWRNNYFNNNLQCSSYHLSDKNLFYYYKTIRDYRPDFIDSYPSSVYIFANFIKKNNLPRFSIKAIITSAETLLDYQRRVIEEIFNCKVFDQYGSAEQVAFICQCEAGSYHINPEYGIIEFINPATQKDAQPGEIAELICTGFTNRAMPLIRYRIGDMGILSNKICSCGRKFSVVEAITGRLDDLIVARDSTKIGRLDPVFKGVGETIVESQIVQIDYEHLALKIVKGRNYSESEGMKIMEEIHKRTGYMFKIVIEYVNSIPREKNGKLRSVISYVNKQTS